MRASAVLGIAQSLVVTLEQSMRRLGEENAQLRAALANRGVIEQAKGILMARHGYDAEAAFQDLTQRSAQERMKVRQIAERLVHEAVAAATQRP